MCCLQKCNYKLHLLQLIPICTEAGRLLHAYLSEQLGCCDLQRALVAVVPMPLLARGHLNQGVCPLGFAVQANLGFFVADCVELLLVKRVLSIQWVV